MMQFLWTELVDPPFDDETKLAYVEMANSHGRWSQIYPIGNVVDGRRVFHGMGSISLCNAVLAFLTERGCDPNLIAIKDKDGVEYGYKRVLVTPGDEETEAVYEVVRDEDIEDLIDVGQDDASLYLQPRTEMIDGEEVVFTPTLNSFAGWKSL